MITLLRLLTSVWHHGILSETVRAIVGPIANPKGPYFQPSLSVCLCVSDRHYPSMLTNFDETCSQEVEVIHSLIVLSILLNV